MGKTAVFASDQAVRVSNWSALLFRVRQGARSGSLYYIMVLISFFFGVLAAALPALSIIVNIHYHDIIDYTRRSGDMPDVEKFIGACVLAGALVLASAGGVWARFGKLYLSFIFILAYLAGFAMVFLPFLAFWGF